MCGVCFVNECNVLALRICLHMHHILPGSVLGDVLYLDSCTYVCVTVCMCSTYTIMHMFLDFLYTYSQDNREAIL